MVKEHSVDLEQLESGPTEESAAGPSSLDQFTQSEGLEAGTVDQSTESVDAEPEQLLIISEREELPDGKISMATQVGKISMATQVAIMQLRLSSHLKQSGCCIYVIL